MSRIKITPEITGQLENFFEFCPPRKFRDNLIEIYHLYILHSHESLPNDFKQMAESIGIFLDFLKSADQELKSRVED